MTTTAEHGRAALAVALLLVFALWAAGCADSAGGGPDRRPVENGGEPADPPGAAEKPPARFVGRLDVGDSGVTVRYSVTNRGREPLLVVNRLPKPSGAGVRYTPDRGYVAGHGEDRVLVSQRAFPWPDSDRIGFAQPPMVGVTRLPPGASTRAEVTVPLPLQRSHPFGDDLGYGTIELPDPVEQVEFCLGVIAPPFPPALSLHRDDGTEVINHGNAAHQAQYLFCTEPVPLG